MSNTLSLHDALPIYPKTQLQEWLQSRKRPLPVYQVESTTGKAHNQTFKVSCTLDNGKILLATGTSRRKAEQDAAKQALEVVKGSKD